MKSFVFITLFLFSNLTMASHVCTASWYGGKFQGRKTASGKIFNTNALMAAHKTLPFGTKIRVTNIENKKAVIVSVLDRGPYIRNRCLDLSRAAKNKLDMDGIAMVKLDILN